MRFRFGLSLPAKSAEAWTLQREAVCASTSSSSPCESHTHAVSSSAMAGLFSRSLSLSHSFSHSLILSLLHSPLRMIHQAQKRKCAHESKVLKLARDDHRVWQTGFTSSELAPLLEKLRSEARAAKMQGFLADSPTASRSSARRLLGCRWAAARSSACFEPAHICSRRMPQSCVATGRPLKSSRSVKDSIFYTC